MREKDFRLDFAIIGVQKASTTALAQYLNQHPDLCLPASKETHYFRRPIRNGVPLKRDISHLTRHFVHCMPGQKCGEATPVYAYWPKSLDLLHEHNPALKCVLSIRHPVRRAYSAWCMEVRRGRESLSFSEAIRSGRERVRNAPMKAHTTFSYVERGYYYEQAVRLLRIFPRQQVFVLRSDMVAPTHPAMKELLAFLEVRPFQFAPILSNINPGSFDPVPGLQEDFEYLQAVFADDLKKFQELGLVDISDWLTGPPSIQSLTVDFNGSEFAQH